MKKANRKHPYDGCFHACVSAVCGNVAGILWEGARQQQAFRALERITEQANNHGGENSKTAAVQTEQSAKEKAAQEYNALKEKNPDFGDG